MQTSFTRKPHPLHGGLEYCRADHCTNTVHPDDSPNDYPFCEIHQARNENYHLLRLDEKRIRDMRNIIKEIVTV